MEIKQSYIQFENTPDGQGTEYLTLSYPVVFNEGVNLKDKLNQRPPLISDMYIQCKNSGLEYAKALKAAKEI